MIIIYINNEGLMGRELMGGMVEVPKGVDINEWMATQSRRVWCGVVGDGRW